VEISPYYKRDRRDINNSLPEDLVEVQSLLRDRYCAARQGRDDPLVSSIDARLLEWHRVRVYDSPPIWTTIQDDEPPDWLLRKREARWTRKMHEQYGPSGHRYRQQGLLDGLFCDLDLPTVHRLLAARTRLRAHGAFEMADAVKLELGIHGVRVFDDVCAFGGLSLSALSTASERVTYGYVEDVDRSKGFEAADTHSCQRVQRLVRSRTEALAVGDHGTVSYLDLELYRTHRVRVDDGAKKWFVTRTDAIDKCLDSSLVQTIQDQYDGLQRRRQSQNQAFNLPIVTLQALDPSKDTVSDDAYRWSRTSSQALLPTCFRSRVEALVRERALRREEGRFLEADALRQVLWRTYVR
jgi:hypothetical protein